MTRILYGVRRYFAGQIVLSDAYMCLELLEYFIAIRATEFLRYILYPLPKDTVVILGKPDPVALGRLYSGTNVSDDRSTRSYGVIFESL